jgi:sulfide:quinone oxidoreductase
VGAPKSGIFAEGAASCYVEFGEGKVARADVDFFSNPAPTVTHFEASMALAAEEKSYDLSQRARWFGIRE